MRKLEELRALALAECGVDVPATVTFDLRGQAAGQARYRDGRIRLNRELLMRYPDDFIGQTIPHEFAHLVTHRLYGSKVRPHGKEWRQVVERLGGKPERTHRYAVTPSRTYRRFLYQCDCRDREHRLTAIRHHRIQRGRIYCCRQCGAPLRGADEG